jgi:hypothetical protein
MLIFFDESFRKSQTAGGKPFGLLVGISMKQEDLSQIFSDVFTLKAKHFGVEIAKKMEIKGVGVFRNFAFKLEKRGIQSKNLCFARDLLDYIAFKKLL